MKSMETVWSGQNITQIGSLSRKNLNFDNGYASTFEKHNR